MQLNLGKSGQYPQQGEQGQYGRMIVSFQHKGLKAYFLEGTKKGIQPAHADKLKQILTALHAAAVVLDMNIPGWKLHELSGDEKGIWSVEVNGNWRITFRFENGNAIIVNYRDYH